MMGRKVESRGRWNGSVSLKNFGGKCGIARFFDGMWWNGATEVTESTESIEQGQRLLEIDAAWVNEPPL